MEQEWSKQFIQAYDELADAIFRHCYFRISDREKAKDMMQDTFMKTWQYLANGGEIQNLKAFLYRTANNLLIDEYRRKKTDSLDILQEAGFDPMGDDADKTINLAEAKTAITAMQKLDEKYREAVMMRFVDDLSPSEIAKVIGETENVVSVRLRRGLNKLKEILEQGMK